VFHPSTVLLRDVLLVAVLMIKQPIDKARKAPIAAMI
jgi:hypothetical protein